MLVDMLYFSRTKTVVLAVIIRKWLSRVGNKCFALPEGRALTALMGGFIDRLDAASFWMDSIC